MALIRFLLLFFLISFFIKVIGRLVMVNRSARSDNRWANYFESQKKKEGSVTVNLKEEKKKKIFTKAEGEYVKYEEID